MVLTCTQNPLQLTWKHLWVPEAYICGPVREGRAADASVKVFMKQEGNGCSSSFSAVNSKQIWPGPNLFMAFEFCAQVESIQTWFAGERVPSSSWQHKVLPLAFPETQTWLCSTVSEAVPLSLTLQTEEYH